MSNSTCDSTRVKELTAPLSASLATVSAGQPALSARLNASIADLEQRLGVVLLEHEGMADELLRVYEQLGIVFDVTRKMLTLDDEHEVAMLLVESLRSSYSDVAFSIVRDVPKGRLIQGDIDALPIWIDDAVTSSKTARRVIVVNSGQVVGTAADGSLLHREEALVASVFAGDDFTCAIVLWQQSADGPVMPWTSGDMLLFDSLASFCGDAILNFRLMQELRDMSLETVRTLVSAVDQKDPYTSGHSNRVGYYSRLLGLEMGFDERQLRELEWTALLHDVGKIGIRDEVLKKAGKLTDEEFEHIKEHPVRGYEVIKDNPHFAFALDGVRHHHERFDGRGYPDGLKGEAIPLQARIIQIADIFDALTTTRSYRNAFSWERAVDILDEEAGTVVDPSLCATFVNMLIRLHSERPQAFEVVGQPDAKLNLTDAMPPSH